MEKKTTGKPKQRRTAPAGKQRTAVATAPGKKRVSTRKPAAPTAAERERKREATKRRLRERLRPAAAAVTPARKPAAAASAALAGTGAAAKLARRIIAILEEKQAIDPVMVDVADRTPLADYFVVAGGRSSTHVNALFQAVYRTLKGDAQLRHSEGVQAAQWILADYGSVIVHLFDQEIRPRYALEELWQAARRD
ncbi:MAG TPA: ribosome silencing factor [bacterium]|nr:ribosome silencing factor [bacterium]